MKIDRILLHLRRGPDLIKRVVDPADVYSRRRSEPRRRTRVSPPSARYDDKVLSFTDCTSFAFLHERGLHEVLAFDSDFSRVGFVERP